MLVQMIKFMIIHILTQQEMANTKYKSFTSSCTCFPSSFNLINSLKGLDPQPDLSNKVLDLPNQTWLPLTMALCNHHRSEPQQIHVKVADNYLLLRYQKVLSHCQKHGGISNTCRIKMVDKYIFYL